MLQEGSMRRLFAILSALALAAAGTLGPAPALAEKPDWVGKGKGPAKADRDDVDVDVRFEVHFGDDQRRIVRDWYGAQFRAGRCPPGLAKKHNGCLPPGQAKKWQRGRPLPRDVIFHDLPPELVVRIGLPPKGYRYVRIANDVLMIVAGTGLVVDAIADLQAM
jgi:Ni/Co efflux regulator RcnB